MEVKSSEMRFVITDMVISNTDHSKTPSKTKVTISDNGHIEVLEDIEFPEEIAKLYETYNSFEEFKKSYMSVAIMIQLYTRKNEINFKPIPRIPYNELHIANCILLLKENLKNRVIIDHLNKIPENLSEDYANNDGERKSIINFKSTASDFVNAILNCHVSIYQFSLSVINNRYILKINGDDWSFLLSDD